MNSIISNIDIDPEESISQIDFSQNISSFASSSRSIFPGIYTEKSMSSALGDDFLIIANDPVILARSKSILKVTYSIQVSILNLREKTSVGYVFLPQQTNSLNHGLIIMKPFNFPRNNHLLFANNVSKNTLILDPNTTKTTPIYGSISGSTSARINAN